MPRRAKGARLHQRSTGIFYIRDTGRHDISTGTRDRRAAEIALANYIATRDRRAGGPAAPHEITVSEVLARYGDEHAPHAADPARIGYAIEALDRQLGGLPVDAISGAVCRRYAADRVTPARRDPETKEVLEWRPVSDGTIRRELGTLRAALEYCRREGYLTWAPAVVLPQRPPARDRWLTRSEAARLLNAARRSKRGRHLTRFILIGLYTGTRKDAILRLQWGPNLQGGWIDLEQGLLYRRGAGQAETGKRQTTATIPRRLYRHLRRWAREGGRFVVSEGDGNRIGSIRTAWARVVREAGLDGVTPHVLRHTAITWAMQRGAQKWDLAGFFGVSMETLERVYAHHHPAYQQTAVEAMDRRETARPYSFGPDRASKTRTNAGPKGE